MASQAPVQKKEGRLAKFVRVTRQLKEEPKSIVGLLRDWMLRLWLSRGGGFYGLGFAVTFIILEVSTIFGEFGSSDSVTEFVTQQVMETVFRLGYQSIINFVMALLWPVFLLEHLGAWAIALLAAGYLGFEHVLRPLTESWLPELREARVQREQRKQEKQEAKQLKKAKKKNR